MAHVFGFRDWVSTITARWCRSHGVPYLFEPIGMFRPKLRKVWLKRTLDSTVYRKVAGESTLAVAVSELERRELAAVVPSDRIAIRPNGFPAPFRPPERPGPLRVRLGLDADVSVVLSVGRVARGKGLEHLIAAVAALDDVQLAIAGPDDGHGVTAELHRFRERSAARDRIHVLGPVDAPLDLYGDADVHALPSAHENFGMVAAEAAAAGTPSVLTDRCGIAEHLRDRGALVIPYGEGPLREALARLLADRALRDRLSRGAQEVAAELSWANVAKLQAGLYARVT